MVRRRGPAGAAPLERRGGLCAMASRKSISRRLFRLFDQDPRGTCPRHHARASAPLRRGGRVVECTALEMRHRCKPIGGSNPSLSAKISPTNLADLFVRIGEKLSRPWPKPQSRPPSKQTIPLSCVRRSPELPRTLAGWLTTQVGSNRSALRCFPAFRDSCRESPLFRPHTQRSSDVTCRAASMFKRNSL